MSAELLMLLGGTSAFLLTLHWVRSRAMSERYALGWLVVACVMLLCGIFPKVIETFADEARLSYPSAVLFVALGAVYLFALRITLTLTRLQRRTILLTQHVALLEERLRALESGTTPKELDS